MRCCRKWLDCTSRQGCWFRLDPLAARRNLGSRNSFVLPQAQFFFSFAPFLSTTHQQSAFEFASYHLPFSASTMSDDPPRKRSRFDQTEPEPRKASRFDRRSRSPSSRHTESRRSRSPLVKDSQSPSAGEKRGTPLDPAAAAGISDVAQYPTLQTANCL